MNKTFSKILIVFCCAAAAAGCSTVENLYSSNANAEDKTREALGLKKTGIPECDQVVEILTRKATGTEGGEQSLLDQAKNKVIEQQIYNYVNDSNKTAQEKADMAEKCKLALGYLKDEPAAKK